MNTIYTVTSLNEDTTRGSRTWGWYPSKEEAEEDFRKCPDLCFESGTFKYLLIEEVPMGIGGTWGDSKRWWYSSVYHGSTYLEEEQASMDTYTITAMDEAPEVFKNIVAFSMG